MSELTKLVRYDIEIERWQLSGMETVTDRRVLSLCDEHERLEGVLRALGNAEIARRKVVEENVWKDRSEYFRAVDDAIHVVCDEAVRLAKESEHDH